MNSELCNNVSLVHTRDMLITLEQNTIMTLMLIKMIMIAIISAISDDSCKIRCPIMIPVESTQYGASPTIIPRYQTWSHFIITTSNCLAIDGSGLSTLCLSDEVKSSVYARKTDNKIQQNCYLWALGFRILRYRHQINLF